MKRQNEKQWRDEKQPRDAVVLKAVETEVTESEEERVLNFKISTETPDSYDDVIKADGWDLERFKKNPVVLWAHSHREPPVGQALAIEVKDGDLVASAQFADAETYEFADTVYRLLKKKFLRATSVGFFPKEWTFDEDRGGYNFIAQELFEFSVVPVPANPDALALAVKDGIDCTPLKEWAEKTLDLWTDDENVALWIPKQQIEDVYKTLSPKTETVTVSDQFDGTEAVVIEEAMEDITVGVMGAAEEEAEFKEKVVEPHLEKLAAMIEVEVDGVPVPEIKDIKFKIDIKEPVEPTDEELRDMIEALRVQVDQLTEKINADEEAAQAAIEDPDDLSAVIDLTIDSHEVDNEIDLAVLDLDVTPEQLQEAVKLQLERELLRNTGTLPKEV